MGETEFARAEKLSREIYFLREEIAEYREALENALMHREEFSDGCLYCGRGEIVDGAVTEEHKKSCWSYRAEALLERPNTTLPKETK